MSNEFVLAIGAHPDDIELGCGGILSRHAAQGDTVLAIVMSAGECGHNGIYNRVDETRKALSLIGLKNILCFDFSDTSMGKEISHLTRAIEVAIDNHIPDEQLSRVYTMCSSDRHQDHRAVHEASIISCRNARQILCYETPSTRVSFRPNLFLEITQQELDIKILALNEHRSQKHRDYMNPEHITTVARFRGLQSGSELSEAFTIHKMVI